MKPMLAATVLDVEALRFPLLASPKLDGVRALVINGVVMSRSMKPIPNNYVQSCLNTLHGWDGELIYGRATARDVYRKTVSAVMSQDGCPEVNFHVFDNFLVQAQPYADRLRTITSLAWAHTRVHSPTELLEYEQKVTEQGYEGIILRDPGMPYKQGRSTLREQGMLKLKRFVDDEAVVVEMKELMHNANPLRVNELGYAHRTSHKENKVPMGTLGALTVAWQGKEFDIGTGFTDAERLNIWNDRYSYINCVCKFKYLAVGMKDLPRHPVFLGWRHQHDV